MASSHLRTRASEAACRNIHMYNGLPWLAQVRKNGVPNQGCSIMCGVRHLARRQASSRALQRVVDIPFKKGGLTNDVTSLQIHMKCVPACI